MVVVVDVSLKFRFKWFDTFEPLPIEELRFHNSKPVFYDVMIISMVIRYFRLMDYDMAYFDMESHKVSALENPFGPKVLGWTATVNYVLGTGCKPCVRYGPFENGRTGEIRTRDQRIKSPLLYRLSYRPIFMALPKKIQGFVGLLAVKKETFGNV